MTISIAIAHAAFDPARTATLKRLLQQIGKAKIMVFHSQEREPASIWAKRLWRWAEDDDATIFLNDDVQVIPDLVKVVESMRYQVPFEAPISLHTSMPVARSLGYLRESWIRTYWLTGPGYVLHRGLPAQLLEWWDNLPKPWGDTINEDVAINLWCYRNKIPCWSSIPALVEHDSTIKSVLEGHDQHPLRQTNVAWHRPEFKSLLGRLEHFGSWKHLDPNDDHQTALPMFIDNPLGTLKYLERADKALRMGLPPGICWFCKKNPAGLNTNHGTAICANCILLYARQAPQVVQSLMNDSVKV